jgi:hypothetical protein
MLKCLRLLGCCCGFAFLVLDPSSLARGDGGTLRLSEQNGKYRITVFTSPAPLRAGPVDVSVLVQDPATGELASASQVTIEAVQSDSGAIAFHGAATTAAATNKLYQAANLDLPEPGWYAVTVSVDGPLGSARVCFDVEAVNPVPSWVTLAPWVGWPFAAIALFAIHQLLRSGNTYRAAARSATFPLARSRSPHHGVRRRPWQG